MALSSTCSPTLRVRRHTLEKDDRIAVYLPQVDEKHLHSWVKTYPLHLCSMDVAPKHWFLSMTKSTLVLMHPTKPALQLSTNQISRRLNTRSPLELAKACGLRPGMTILDGFGGWGVDGLTLALLGGEVTICERHPLVHMMQRDLGRRLNHPAKHVFDDVHHYLESSQSRFETIYLDPMFPVHSKSAKAQRQLEVLAELATQDGMSPIFDLALSRATERVVVKRRLKHRDLVLPKPNWSVSGRSVRFDVYRTTH